MLLGFLLASGMIQAASADSNEPQQEKMTHHNMMHSANDERISLGLAPKMKQHQLSNMRSHLKAIQTIIGLIGDGQFENASKTAHSRLGLTEDMKEMCNMIDNDDFRKMGLAFHKSADALGDVLLTKDINKSLHALQETMDYCVQCHAAYRQ